MFGPRKNQTTPASNLTVTGGQFDLGAVPAAWPVAVSPLARAVETFRHIDKNYDETGSEIDTPTNALPTLWPQDANPTRVAQPGKSAK